MITSAAKKLLTVTAIGMLTVFSSIVSIPTATAKGFQVEYVDPIIILQRLPEGKAVQQRIQNLYDRKQIELGTSEQELQSELQEYQQVGVISEEARLAGEERLTQIDLEFRQLQSDAKQEIQQASAGWMAPLFEQIQRSVDNIAETERTGFNFKSNNGRVRSFGQKCDLRHLKIKRSMILQRLVIQDLGI